jgi:hypothetical protein
MTTFAHAVQNQPARTENGMAALQSTGDSLTNLFFNIGSSRNADITPAFVAAYVQDKEVAGRIALWARDAREGAGERKTFRTIIRYLVENDPDMAVRMLERVPELGRWDDVVDFVEAMVSNPERKSNNYSYVFGFVVNMIRIALVDNKDGLCAKWMSRNGPTAVAIRSALGWSPKRWRKTLVTLSKTVEQQMCAKDWNNINYSHVPSVAAARYQKAFNKHDPERYQAYRNALTSTDPKVKETVKINAGAVYPYDILRSIRNGDPQVALAQWEALPNYVGDANILPLVDVSGSMSCPASGSISCLDVAVSLGLYLADKNKGKFKDTFLTFSSRPQLLHLQGNLLQKIQQMETSKWEMNTNLHAAFERILGTALKHKVPQEEMPNTLLILSDMQFDACIRHDDSAHQMIVRKYNDANYQVPNIVFWNLNAMYGNVPVSFKQNGTALISGFSPAIMKSVLGGKEYTPVAIMNNTISNPRYDY